MATILHSATVPPMPAVARILARYDRDKLEAFIAVAIDLLDVTDAPADPDAADFATRSDGGPGDPSDAEPDDDAKGDQSWTEWHTRGRHKLARGQYEASASNGDAYHEDSEDDDPAEAACNERDTGGGEDEELTGLARYFARGPGCLVSDTGIGDMDGMHHA